MKKLIKSKKAGEGMPWWLILCILAAIGVLVAFFFWPKIILAKDMFFDILGIKDKEKTCGDSGQSISELKESIKKYLSDNELGKSGYALDEAFRLSDELLKCAPKEKDYVKGLYIQTLDRLSKSGDPFLASKLYIETANKFPDEKAKISPYLLEIVIRLKRFDENNFKDVTYAPVQANVFLFLNNVLDIALADKNTGLINTMKTPFLSYAYNLIDSPNQDVRTYSSIFITKIKGQVTSEEIKTILGPKINELIEKLYYSRNAEITGKIEEILSLLGEPAVKPVIEQLKGSEPNYRASIISILSKIGIPAIPSLIEAAIKNENPQISNGAAQVISMIYESTPESSNNLFLSLLNQLGSLENTRSYLNDDYTPPKIKEGILGYFINNIQQGNSKEQNSIKALKGLNGFYYDHEMLKIISKTDAEEQLKSKIKGILVEAARTSATQNTQSADTIFLGLFLPFYTSYDKVDNDLVKGILIEAGPAVIPKLNKAIESKNAKLVEIREKLNERIQQDSYNYQPLFSIESPEEYEILEVYINGNKKTMYDYTTRDYRDNSDPPKKLTSVSFVRSVEQSLKVGDVIKLVVKSKTPQEDIESQKQVLEQEISTINSIIADINPLQS
ncbi:MAG: hypothetical protein KKC75_06195 [Nanoarchaeota archaeon]|nr:hypothetical protein [Nanoarchaeota archaeon]MBU1946153.1 hypothetical protein [Nanoarchaeota archaeon]